MPKLGKFIEADDLIAGAMLLAQAETAANGTDRPDSGPTIAEKYDLLRAQSVRTIGTTGIVAVFSNIFLGWDPVDREYWESTTGFGAGLAGRFDGLSSVFTGEPVELRNGAVTSTVPVLEFEVADIQLEDVDLGSAQLYPKVAVPLVGQIPVMFHVLCPAIWGKIDTSSSVSSHSQV